MFFKIDKKNAKLKELMRRAGYRFDHRDRKTGELSFSRKLFAGRKFPRFHAYVADKSDHWLSKIHLDQKPHSYEGKSAHLGEYEGPALEKEVDRIKRVLDKQNKLEEPEDKEQTKNRSPMFWVFISILALLFLIFIIFWL